MTLIPDIPMDIKVIEHAASFDAAHHPAVKEQEKRGFACKCNSTLFF